MITGSSGMHRFPGREAGSHAEIPAWQTDPLPVLSA